MNMHAYLIMTHGDIYILHRLLKLLDYEKNDIYLHIDKKMDNVDFDFLKSLIKKGNIYFIDRMDVRWGSKSQIFCELKLLEEAVKKKHKYYHFISGVDLPLKTQSEIHDFFDNSGKEFIEFDNDKKIDEKYLDRIKYYHVAVNHLRSKNKIFAKVAASIRFHFVDFQRKLGVNRIRKSNIDFQKGPNWFSITHDLAEYIVKQASNLKCFNFSYCADELFVQTIVFNSKFKYNLYMENGKSCSKRLIDWQRGNPYTFTNDDYKLLCNSDCMFARKFSSNVDKKIIDAIYKKISGEDFS